MKMTISWFDVPKVDEGQEFSLDSLSKKAKSELERGLVPYSGLTVRVRVTKSQPRMTDEDKAAKIQAKADKKAAAAKAKEEKATAKAQKAADKAAKKAEKESEKESAEKVVEKTEAAAQKAIDSKPTKKSHHNPAKGY
jgi:hypothetical protein